MGNLLQAQNRIDEAVTHYRRALALAPDSPAQHIALGLALEEQGSRSEAVAQARRAERLDRAKPFPHFSLGLLFARCGEAKEAELHLLRYLDGDPEDREGARIMLAKLGLGEVPDRAPTALLDAIYARRATSWDDTQATPHAYRGAQLVAEALFRLTSESDRLSVLDAGCGTGLVGSLIAARAARLEGVDRSGAMLEQARHKQVYHACHEADLVDFLQAHRSTYDAITSAATLIHFGDLRPVFSAAASALQDGGLFVFTVFPGDGARDFAVHADFGLAYAGCYAHGRDYITRIAGETGFGIASMDLQVHEHRRGKPVTGLVVVLRRQGG
jgi:predicted TPR repeat methyltransferase